MDRVASDLQQHEAAARAAEQDTFDVHDDALFHDLLGNDRMGKPVQDLLIALEQIEMTDASFGTNGDNLKAYIVPKLKALREACKAEWRDA